MSWTMLHELARREELVREDGSTILLADLEAAFPGGGSYDPRDDSGERTASSAVPPERTARVWPESDSARETSESDDLDPASAQRLDQVCKELFEAMGHVTNPPDIAAPETTEDHGPSEESLVPNPPGSTDASELEGSEEHSPSERPATRTRSPGTHEDRSWEVLRELLDRAEHRERRRERASRRHRRDQIALTHRLMDVLIPAAASRESESIATRERPSDIDAGPRSPGDE